MDDRAVHVCQLFQSSPQELSVCHNFHVCHWYTSDSDSDDDVGDDGDDVCDDGDDVGDDGDDVGDDDDDVGDDGDDVDDSADLSRKWYLLSPQI